MSYKVAITSSDGIHIDRHFGESSEFRILAVDERSGSWIEEKIVRLDEGTTVAEATVPGEAVCGQGCSGHDDARLASVVSLLRGCSYLLTKKIGKKPYKALEQGGIRSLESPEDLGKAIEGLTRYLARKPGQDRAPVRDAAERVAAEPNTAEVVDLYPDFFNDVFGPIMQGGSSGAFAGPCRIGNVARSLIRGEPARVRFLFDRKDTVLGHLPNFMTDRGYLGGVLGFLTDDVRLFAAHEIARSSGVSYDFDYADDGARLSRGVLIEIEGTGGERGTLVAESIGGGMIEIRQINGFAVTWQSDTFGLLVNDAEGLVTSGDIASFERIAGESHVRTAIVRHAASPLITAKGVFFEFSSAPDVDSARKIFSPAAVIAVPALLPVVTTRGKKPQLFRTVGEWRNFAKERGISFVQAAIEYEKASSGWDDEKVWDFFRSIVAILRGQIHSLEKTGYGNAVPTPLLPIYGDAWDSYARSKGAIADRLTAHILTHAFSTNAKLPGVKIVPGPMGTGGGYLFSALDAVREERGYSEERLVESIAVAAALGAIAFTHTNASGEVGCVGESGVCCAMASGSVAWLAGGDGLAVERAASMALQANIGIPCDPIPGGLEFPCITRTIRAAVTAPLYADLALAGIDPLIPYHEVLQAIERNYRTTDSARLCGAKCGCNLTPTAERLMLGLERGSVESLHYRAGSQ